MFGILNDRVDRNDAFLYGIPYPGVYVTNEEGVVVSRFFHDSYKKRDSPELLIDAALGRLVINDEEPRVSAGDEEVRVTAVLHGGSGSIRQGIRRQLVVRFEMSDGLHVYGEPVPEGMIPVGIELNTPPGLVVEEAEKPPTTALLLKSANTELQVWSGTADFVYPVYATGQLASETRPLDADTTTIGISVSFQACNDEVCLLPKKELLELELPLDVIDVPALGTHMGHGQREAGFSMKPHALRLMGRKVRQNPLGLPRFIWKNIKLELAALGRRIRSTKGD